MYPIELVRPMTQELTELGFKSLHSVPEVDQELNKSQGTCLLVVNSVCGCAARNARPAVRVALEKGPRPEKLVTVFAGVDTDATSRAREYLLPYPASSPAMALFKDGKLVTMIERHSIEGRSADMIAADLNKAFEKFCTAQ
ncbi:MAG: BrxA/BrxB family bacilliredoxin [Saprospiraceae bacterium]|jgi:putative YphP/YqiW family bacilliredoxin|nr:BrxA/BrxB family bacilliredoxin [Saprospiraceae bacterium]MBK7796530.1 BrxA/BrxB family bacilliredoxin [Saprospiraceae bacterium]MBL0260077.1 BrxA/BrxB family bacilliredoxin [Saprospiraceae bacterium]HMS28389.1 BrxA/BrxB family bacilliredoxin [Saprospiraceae bacterium]